jgi:hypothetical protein
VSLLLSLQQRNNSVSIVGSGGAVAGGSALVERSRHSNAAGGTTSGGLAVVERSRHSFATGGAASSGTAPVERTRVVRGSAGAVSSGAAVITTFSNSNVATIVGSGGLVSGGAAITERTRVAMGTGGASASGAAGVSYTPHVSTSSGGGRATPRGPRDAAVPSLHSINPTTVAARGRAFQLRVQGSSFSRTSVVLWDGARRPTTFVSSDKLAASIEARDIVVLGLRRVTVLTPGEGTSNELPLRVVFDWQANLRENERLHLLELVS